MNLYLGTNIENLRHARRWVLAPGVEETLRTTIDWVARKEVQWRCAAALFFEVSCYRRPGESGSQIDLLIAFRDRIATCEVKSGPAPDRGKLTDSAGQATRQADLIRTRLRENAGCKLTRRPAPLLFFPSANEPELRRIHRGLNDEGFAHVRPAGCLTAGRGCGLDLAASLERWLAESQITFSSGECGLDEHVRNNVVSSMIERIASLDQLVRYLQEFRAPVQSLRQPLWHIATLRESARHQAMAMLGASPLLEIVAQEGVGKSAVVKDLFAYDLGCEPREVTLRHCFSGQAVLRHLYDAALNETAMRAVGDQELLGCITNSDSSLWISNYDAFSRPSLKAVVAKLVGHATHTDTSWRVVIESRHALGIDQLPSIVLSPLPDAAIASIIQVAPWQCHHPLDEIVSSAAGNPGFALVMSRSRFVTDPIPIEKSRDDRFTPWFVLVDLALDDLHASIVLARQELGAQAVLMAVQASRKILESILLARGEIEPATVAAKRTLTALVREVARPHAAEQEWDYLGEYASDAADELDRWCGSSGELTRYPGGTAASIPELMERHPGASFHPYIAVDSVIRAARLVNWGQFWFRTQAPWMVKFRGRQVCELCSEGMQQPRRPMYVCGVCVKWICEYCSLLFRLSNEPLEHDDRICDDCHKLLAKPEDHSKLDTVIEQLRREGRWPLPDPESTPNESEE